MYYFEHPENRERLKLELDSWLGTPFKHWCGVKGRGCDCIHFVARVMTAVGAVDAKKVKKALVWYNRDWHLHNDRELLYENLQNFLRKSRTAALEFDPMLGSLVNGDVLLYKYGKAMSHAGIYFEELVYQSVTGVGVEKISSRDPQWSKRLRLGIRVM